MNNTHTSHLDRRRIANIGLGAAVLGLMLPMAACSRGSSAASADAMPNVAAVATSTEVDCDPAAVDGLEHTPTCYEVSVPEDWSNPDADDRVVLSVAVFRATDPAATAEDPIIYLEGGPGGEVIAALPFIEADHVDPYVATRDVILFDQRGVGTSTPNLACDEEAPQALDALDKGLTGDDLDDAYDAALRACHDRLEGDGVNLAAYNSVASSHDIEAIRTTLGYERLNIWGISYGTRLAQTYMRLYSNSVRAAVIDSVEPVAADVNELIPTSSKRSIEMLFDACAADAGCAAAYPDFETEFWALVDQLNDTPADVTFTDADGNEHTRKFTGDDLAGTTFGAMYDKYLFAAMPQVIAEASQGNFDAIGVLESLDQLQGEYFSDGMYQSVVCHEEVPFESRDDLADNAPDDENFGQLSVFTDEGNFDSCEFWEAGRAPEVENKPVNSDIPTLVLTGSFDPITPPSYAQQVADHLGNVSLFEFPTEGHGVSTTECGTAMIGAFVDDPSKAPDDSCIDDMPGPAWTSGSTPTESTPFEIPNWGADAATLSGLRPGGWEDFADGDFRRGETFLDPTQLLLLPIDGMSTEDVLGRLSGVTFGASGADTIDVDGEAWEFHTGDADGLSVAVLITPARDTVVVLVANPTEYDQLVETAAVPVAASLAVS